MPKATRKTPGKKTVDHEAEAANTASKRKTVEPVVATAVVQNPSAVLNSLQTSLTPSTFASVVLKHLGPALDSLPAAQRSNISRILLEAQKSIEATQQRFGNIDFYSKQQQLEDFVITLDANEPKPRKKSNRCPIGDPHMSDEDFQGGKIDPRVQKLVDISNELTSWLPVLWRTGVESHAEIDKVHQALMTCKKVSESCKSDDWPEWFEIEPVPVMMDSTGECIYNGEEWGCLNDGIDHAIHWIWREMLLEELASGKDIAFMVTDITSLGIHVDILKLLDRKIDMVVWEAGIKEVVPRLREILNGA